MPLPTYRGPLISGAAALSELAAEHAVQSEQNRIHPEPIVAGIRDAGFTRHFTPSRWGGNAGTFADFVGALIAVGRADASVAWSAAVTASTSRMASFLPADGQAALWGDTPDAWLASALKPSGTARPVDGGWRLSGAWPFLTGIGHSGAALVSCHVPMSDGSPQLRLLLVPRQRYTHIEQSWTSIGMCATGSNTLVLDEVFVPATHTFANADFLAGSPPNADHGKRLPHAAVSGLTFAAPIVGAARGALDVWLELTRIPARTLAERHQLTAARCAAEVDAADLLLRTSADLIDRTTVLSERQVAQAHRDHAFAAELATTAVNRLYATAGTRGGDQTVGLQRHWRDVNTAAAHPALQFHLVAQEHATALLAGGSPHTPTARPKSEGESSEESAKPVGHR